MQYFVLVLKVTHADYIVTRSNRRNIWACISQLIWLYARLIWNQTEFFFGGSTNYKIVWVSQQHMPLLMDASCLPTDKLQLTDDLVTERH